MKIVCYNENEKYCYFIVEMNVNIFELKSLYLCAQQGE